MLKKILILTLLFLLAGCSSWKPLKAPCTYNNRAACGPLIPLQQKSNATIVNNT